MHTFDTPRLQLRPLGGGDEALYCSLYTDPVLMRHIGMPMSADAARRSFRTALALAAQPDPATRLWAIADRGSPSTVGLLARIRHAGASDEAEMGIMLVEQAQGRGLAAEAMGALTDRLFALPGVRRVWTRQSPGNAAVVRLMHRLGFERDHASEGADAEWRWHLHHARWQARRTPALA